MHTQSPARAARLPLQARLLILALAVLLLTPALASFVTDHESRARWEKRALASFDQVGDAITAKELFTALEQFINDHIGFAMPLNKFYRHTQFYLFGDSPIPNVSIGSDGFVFVNSASTLHPNQRLVKTCKPANEAVARAGRHVRQMFDAVRGTELSLTFAVVPSKLLLYADRLPNTVPNELREACASLEPQLTLPGQLEKQFGEQQNLFYFPLTELARHRDAEAFYPPGNFHSNSMSNHLFAEDLLQKMGIEPGEGFSKGASLRSVRADIKMLGFEREALVWSYPYDDYVITSRRQQPKWIRKFFKHARDFGTFETGNPASERVALVFSNSFGKYVTPHIAPGFRRLHHISLNDVKIKEMSGGLSEVIARLQPTDLIILVHDGGITNPKLEALSEQLKTALRQASKVY